jgi:hypothetical protein
MAKQRVARCACGQLSVTVEGEPDLVTACSCTYCQRRTGSPFGVGAYFKREVAVVAGTSRAFRRDVAGTDRALTNEFCPTCGSTLFWTLDLRPKHIGIAVGYFLDPKFPPPARVVWTDHNHAWVQYPPNMPTFPKAAPS